MRHAFKIQIDTRNHVYLREEQMKLSQRTDAAYALPATKSRGESCNAKHIQLRCSSGSKSAQLLRANRRVGTSQQRT